MKGLQGKSGAPAPILAAPAVQALVLQVISFAIVVFVDFVFCVLDLSISLLTAALLQGSVATGLSYWRRLATWWLAIQFVFPIALILALFLQLPPFVFLALFVVFMVLYWNTFRTQVPYYPSRSSTWKAVESILPPESGLTFVDIGSGLGGLLFNLADRRPDAVFAGIEIAPLPWLISVLRARCSGSIVSFTRGDYFDVDLGSYDVVFAYLSPAAMPALWSKACSEMQAGSMLLSYEFLVPDALPAQVVPTGLKGTEIYVWRM